jgi:hypothetical protein
MNYMTLTDITSVSVNLMNRMTEAELLHGWLFQHYIEIRSQTGK